MQCNGVQQSAEVKQRNQQHYIVRTWELDPMREVQRQVMTINDPPGRTVHQYLKESAEHSNGHGLSS